LTDAAGGNVEDPSDLFGRRVFAIVDDRVFSGCSGRCTSTMSRLSHYSRLTSSCHARRSSSYRASALHSYFVYVYFVPPIQAPGLARACGVAREEGIMP
jgi:hypothetical protein